MKQSPSPFKVAGAPRGQSDAGGLRSSSRKLEPRAGPEAHNAQGRFLDSAAPLSSASRDLPQAGAHQEQAGGGFEKRQLPLFFPQRKNN